MLVMMLQDPRHLVACVACLGLGVAPAHLHPPSAVLWRLGSKKGRGRTGGNRKVFFERDVLLSGLFEVEVARPRLLNPFWDSEVEGETNYPVADPQAIESKRCSPLNRLRLRFQR